MSFEDQRVARARRLSAEPLKELGRRSSLVRDLKRSAQEVWERRELLGLLVRRELRARYKDSNLGFAWSLFKPLSQLLIYYIVIGHFLGAARGIPQFAVFVFSGLTIWTFFLEVVNGGTGAIVANSGLVKKVYLPREIFPMTAVGTAAVNSGIQFLVLLVAVTVTRSFPKPVDVLYLVPGIAVVAVFSFSIALLLAALNVYLRDIQHLIEVVTFLLFWASPIVYSYSFVEASVPPWVSEIYLANPVTLGVLAFHRGLWAADDSLHGASHLGLRLAVALVVSCICLIGAHRVFTRLEGNFAQEL